jgi:hypothetical protein
MSNLKILAKLHKIMTAVDYIQKDKINDFHRYRYASEAAIKEKLHAELVKNGVLFKMDVTDFTLTPVTTAKGNQEMLTTIKAHYAFCDVESGEEVVGSFVGSGQDPADKGLYKAVTGAVKYILTSTFLIPTGDDPEAEEPQQPKANARVRAAKDAPPFETDPRKVEITRLVRALGFEPKSQEEWVTTVKSLTEADLMDPAAYDTIVERLTVRTEEAGKNVSTENEKTEQKGGLK